MALFENTTLRRVNIRNNALGPLTSYVLAMAARFNDHLELLDISGNDLGRLGGRQILGLVLDRAPNLDVRYE